MLSEKDIDNVRKRLIFEKDALPNFFDALSDKNRYGMFKLLLNQKEICVTDISMIFGISVSAASQHLKILEQSGLVYRERMGQEICYKVKKEDPVVRLFVKMAGKQIKKATIV